jgi:hypothetical protein
MFAVVQCSARGCLRRSMWKVLGPAAVHFTVLSIALQRPGRIIDKYIDKMYCRTCSCALLSERGIYGRESILLVARPLLVHVAGAVAVHESLP